MDSSNNTMVNKMDNRNLYNHIYMNDFHDGVYVLDGVYIYDDVHNDNDHDHVYLQLH